MTMNNIFSKLKKENKGNYRQLLFCLAFAVLLVTSFASTMFSPTIQNALDDGGDSRKMIAMIFVVAIVGCLLFSVYAIGLFLKYKSKETGVFLALGAPKKTLGIALYTEFFKILFQCTIVGLILGALVSFGIWQGFSLLLADDERLQYQFSALGLLGGVIFAIVIGLVIFVLATQFMRRSNLMDIINDQRRSEPLGAITKAYGTSGVVFLIVGLVLGYAVPVIMGNVFHILMPGIWNVMYLLALLGMYRIIAYAISSNRRGKNPQKYYKKLISSSMMKFQGKQTVRNMLVIALLVAASLFALSYVPMNGFANLWNSAANPTDFALHYKLSADEVTKSDIDQLAQEHGVNITAYDELIFSELVASGVNRDYTDEGDYFEDYQNKYHFSEFVRESTYNEIMKTNIAVPTGGYILLTQPDEKENVWVKYNDLDQVTNFETEKTMQLVFFEALENHSIALNTSKRYVLNNQDYDEITKGISSEHQTRQILFNVEEVEKSYPFAKALLARYLEKAPPEMGRMTYYDEYQHIQAVEEGREYGYAPLVELTSGNPLLFGGWRYYPTMKIMIEKLLFQEFAVQFLLFTYVAVICLAAVGIIAYTRSISVGLTNKRLFEDLEKLGANTKYITNIITSQLSKIFIIPTVMGSILIFAFLLLMYFGNDGQFTGTELKVYGVNLLMGVGIWMYMFIIYRVSLKKAKKIVGVH